MEVGLSSGQGGAGGGRLCCSGHIHWGGVGSQAGGGDVSLFSQETMQGGSMHEETTESTGGGEATGLSQGQGQHRSPEMGALRRREGGSSSLGTGGGTG